MPDNRQNQSYTLSNGPPIDNLQEGIRGMKIEIGNGDGDDNLGGDSSPPYPDRPGEPDCIYYLRTGLCGYGSKCRFNHPSNPPKIVQGRGDLPQRAGQPDCGFFVKTGTCKYGSSCKYHHPSQRDIGIAGQELAPAPLNALGLPTRQDARPCPYYMRTYTCKFGARCKFNHPQLSSADTVLPVSGASAFGTMNNSSGYQSTGMPYANGLSAWLLPRSPHLSGPRVPGPQSYAPVVIPSSPGFMTAHGWNTYVGTVPPANFYGTNFYNAKDQEGLGANGQFDSLSKIPSFPERPDQPECRYFMSTGSCKYGSDCKYHHPKERIAHPSMNSLGPHGLPLRHGEAVCSNFSMYGVCIYGPACKFDHPVAGYVSGYGFNLQQSSLSVHDQPSLPYQGNSLINNYAESSPSKSVKISDWIPKPEPVDEDNEYPDANSPEDPKQLVDDPPQEPSTSSEVSHDH